MQASASQSLGLRKQLGRLEARKQRILEQVADGDITAEDFAQLRASTAASAADIRSQLAVTEGQELDQDTCLAFVQHLIWNASATWQTAPLLGQTEATAQNLP